MKHMIVKIIKPAKTRHLMSKVKYKDVIIESNRGKRQEKINVEPSGICLLQHMFL